MSASRASEGADGLRRSTRLQNSRTQKTVNLLLDAGLELMAEHGYESTQVNDIATAAGVSRATFYNHFESKEELLWELIVSRLPRMMGSNPEVQAEDAETSAYARIRAANNAYFEAYERDATLMKVWDEAASRSKEARRLLHDARLPFLVRTEQSIRRLQARNLADPTVDAEYAAQALTGMVSRFAYTWFVAEEPFDRERAYDAVTRLWANAIGLREDGNE
jgi:AcrR family transcriptional regulator